MCGLVALLSDSPIDSGLVIRMRDRLIHRGPDHGGLWVRDDKKLAFGHRRLAIIDVSAEANQPMQSEDGRFVITYNGEIYNYLELRETLARAGHTFRTGSDTEVLLASYMHWGVECLSRLNGMFAFALWDAVQHRLFVARDRFGEKPLFWARPKDGCVAFASEMKALLCLPGVSDATNEDVLAKYVAGTYYEDGPETFFRDIQRLPPAHAMVFDSGGNQLRHWRYWTPDYNPIDASIGEGAAVERFRELLERSVRMRMRADVALGSSLSGGLDSSTLVGFLAKLRETETSFTQNTFSARFDDDLTISEGPQIDAVVKQAGAHPFSVSPSPQRLMEESLRLHWHQEEPFLSASIYLQWCVARLAQENNTIVLIDGQGADEVLAGYQHYFKSFQLDLLDKREYWSAIRETIVFNGRLRRASRGFKDSARRFNPRVAFSLPEIIGMAGIKRPALYKGPYDVGVPDARPGLRLRRQLAEALQYNCLPQLLRYADRNSMAFSREARLPFLDYDLVDYCISLPDSLWIKDGWQKLIMRKAADGLIPVEIQWRADKVGYAAPLDIWLRGELKQWCLDRLFSGPILEVPGYQKNALRDLWDAHQSGSANNSWALWRWISLNEWFSLRASGAWRDGIH
ncbi:MAG: asparagine synthase (glutamine-hydrolyzing) [Candidatus Accumulibacter necessarius]|jgi:asparagine synthase (glutamine-hydrolysing)|uniref:asparagine synthase (glutamine-hydrolyzing) n=1 Tax=Candidatus Accumulibacter necessarius TaxID=2954386 RepID=UPI002FC2B25D